MFCTMDIEASGFGRHSYPIEVGFVRGDGHSWCTLIQPLPAWTHWDAGAAGLHGIAREQLLQHGRSAADVAKRLNQDLAGQTVYCDGWAHDYSWLATLFDAADQVPRFKLESVHRLLDDPARAALGPALDQVRALQATPRHRASHDARVLQAALAQVLGP